MGPKTFYFGWTVFFSSWHLPYLVIWAAEKALSSSQQNKKYQVKTLSFTFNRVHNLVPEKLELVAG